MTAPNAPQRKRSSTSPTKRSLDLLRSRGYRVAVVERWNPYARIRQDLFGIVDILAIRAGETLAVQATSGDNVTHRIEKIAGHEATPDIRAAGWTIVVHGWRKLRDGKWHVREENVS